MAERDQLRAVCLALGVSASDGQQQQLLDYLDLLQRWNATYNLTAVRDRAQMLVQHLADCLAVVPAVAAAAGAAGTGAAAAAAVPVATVVAAPRWRVLDVGSGGGLPGVVLAICLPEIQVVTVDAVGKKAAFVRQVAGSLRLANLEAVHARVEDLSAAPFGLVTSRAFASLSLFTRLTRPHLAAGGVWMAMKGQSTDSEQAELAADIDVFHVEQLRVPGLDAQRRLVWMRIRP